MRSQNTIKCVLKTQVKFVRDENRQSLEFNWWYDMGFKGI